METRIELPGCTLQEVHQAGTVLTFYSRDGQPPHAAELASNDGRLSAEIGLEWVAENAAAAADEAFLSGSW